MQQFTPIQSQERLTDSRQELVNNDLTVMSCNSGTTFPTTNLVVGMFCFRTDLNQLYQLKDMYPTWVLIHDISKTATNKEYVDTKLDLSEVVSTPVAGKVLRLNSSGVIPAPIHSIPTTDVGGNIWISTTTTGVEGLSNPVGFATSTTPASPQANQLWFDSSTRKTKVWDGNVWQEFNDTIPASTLVAIGTNIAPTSPAVYQVWFDAVNRQTKIWDGGSWQPFVTNQNIYKAVTSSVAQTITSSIPVIVNGLSITLTPQRITSKFLVMAVVNGSMGYVASSVITRNGSQLVTGGTNNNNTSAGKIGTQATTHFGWSPNNNAQILQHYLLWVDAPGITASITYDVRHMSAWAGGTYTTIVNDRNSADMTSPSSLVVVEF